MTTNPFIKNTVHDTWAVSQRKVVLPTVQMVEKKHVQPELPPIVSAGTLIGDNAIQAPPELIKGLLHQGLKGILGGPSKAGKTWLLLDMAISVANGMKWLDWECEKSKVLFVNFEIPPYFIKERVRAIINKKEGANSGNLDLWNLRGYAAPFESLLPKMEERLKDKYGLVIIDPFYKGMAGDENKAGDIARSVNDLEKLCVRTGAALVFAHHFSKGNKASTDVLDRMSGSGVFGRDPDTIITLTEHKETNCFVVETVVRNLRKPRDFVIERDFPMVIMRDLNPTDLKAKGGRPTKNVTAAMLTMVENTALSTTDWKIKAEDELGLKKTAFSERKKKFADHGWINQGVTKAWSITEAGRKELERLRGGATVSDDQSED